MSPETTKFASVTSITDCLPKFLTWWAGNAVADCAFNKQAEWKHLATREERIDYVKSAHQRLKSDAADLGTQVHEFVEAVNLGKPTPTWPLPVKARMTNFASFVEATGLVVEAAETKVYSRTHGYAGTLDILGRLTKIDDRMAVIDVKTGKGIYGDSMAPQVAAYAHGDFLVADPHHPGAKQITPKRGKRWYEWHGEPDDEIAMPKVQAGYVLHLRDDSWAVHEVVDLAGSFAAFCSLLPVNDWLRVAKGALHEVMGEVQAKPSAEELAALAISEFGERAA